ncbi:MAG: hypothetical protein MJ212_05510, partial [Alphaproteobacteria bacterium]|nr:hypothetical protein [Alphaproteobacteria bacterium]
SMIEMLGVLAIIGVLSVGGIVGYTKAMMKFKINKAINQIVEIQQNIKQAFAHEKGYTGFYAYDYEETLKVVKALNLVPQEMIDENSTLTASDTDYPAYITNPFGGGVQLGNDLRTDAKTFVINYWGLPREACVALASYNWLSLGNLTSISVRSFVYTDLAGETDFHDGEKYKEYDDAFFAGNIDKYPYLMPLPLDKIAKACDCPDNTCEVIWGFKEP